MDLAASFGPRYAKGDEFLRRLERLEACLQSGDPAVRSQGTNDLALLQREALLANPLVSGQPLLFVVRQQYAKDHHNTATFFPSARHEYNNGKFTPGGALKLIDLARGGAVRTLLATKEGVVRDPEVHFSGRKIIFAFRQNQQDSYHLYEIQIDGSGLRQLTFAPEVDDLDPLYLADDSIVFTSTREPKYCMCNRHIMANLFRMEADGANLHQIGKSTLFEGHPALLPDGRILYDRWEYVDRNFGDAQALWTVNPDGTTHALFWGNNTASPGAVIDARAVPGTEWVMAVLSSCHDRPWGALGLIDRRLGLDGLSPILRTWPATATNLVRQTGWHLFDQFSQVKPKYEDPWPLSDKYFLCARQTGNGEQTGLYLLDLFGNEILLHQEAPGCFDPMPVAPSPRPPVLPTRRDFAGKEGYFYIADVYQGTHMQGVARGAVKRLRVVESPEKRTWSHAAWNGQGQEAPAMNWHDFNNKRILGTVPVEADGSVYFAAPSERFLYFQLLDEKGMMIQSMRSGVMVQSGEQAGCIGCHEDRRAGPPAKTNLHPPPDRLPRKIEDWFGPPRLFNYLAEVQPVFDRHCVRCHDFGAEPGKKLNLAADRDLVFNVSYNELWRKQYVAAIGAGPAEILPPRSWGSAASKLMASLENPRCRGQLSREEFERLATWIDLNAPYYPTYACAYPQNLAGRSPLDDPQLARLEQLTGVPFRNLASHNGNRGPQISFDRPELSPCLSQWTDRSHPEYLEALNLIRAGQANLAAKPEADRENFVACDLDLWREAKYLERQRDEERRRAAIRTGAKAYDVGSRK